MSIRYKLPILFIIWLGTFIGLFWMTSTIIPLPYYLLLSIPVIIFFLVSDRFAFFLFIMLSLLTAFSLLYLAFILEWSSFQQISGITLHILLLLHLFSLYSLSKYVFYLQTDNFLMKKKLKELEEYVVDDHVLSRREFEKQADNLITSMDRKKEYGFLVKVGVTGMNKHVKHSAMISLAVIIYETLRKNYDLIGQYNENTLIFLLQDTHEEGLEIVTKRIKYAFLSKFEPEILDQLDWDISKTASLKDLK